MGTNWSGGCHSSVELPPHVAVLEGEWIEWWEGPVVGGVSGGEGVFTLWYIGRCGMSYCT